MFCVIIYVVNMKGEKMSDFEDIRQDEKEYNLNCIVWGEMTLIDGSKDYYKIAEVDFSINSSSSPESWAENYIEENQEDILFNYEEETGKKAKCCDLHECEVL